MEFSHALDPFVNFESAVNRAVAQGVSGATAMYLATCGKDLRPSVRTVLYKGIVRGGVAIYTNYNSTKALDLAENENAALLFHWESLAQQVRFEGSVQKLTRAESEAYFATRPRLAQLGAWACDAPPSAPCTCSSVNNWDHVNHRSSVNN